MHLYHHFIIQATEYVKNFLIIVSAYFTYLVIFFIYIFVYFIFVLIYLLFHLFSQEPSRPPPRLGVNTESFRKCQTRFWIPRFWIPRMHLGWKRRLKLADVNSGSWKSCIFRAHFKKNIIIYILLLAVNLKTIRDHCNDFFSFFCRTDNEFYSSDCVLSISTENRNGTDPLAAKTLKMGPLPPLPTQVSYHY